MKASDTWNSKQMQMSQLISDCHRIVFEVVLANQTSYPLIRILDIYISQHTQYYDKYKVLSHIQNTVEVV